MAALILQRIERIERMPAAENILPQIARIFTDSLGALILQRIERIKRIPAAWEISQRIERIKRISAAWDV